MALALVTDILAAAHPQEPQFFSASDYGVNPDDISYNARQVVEKLHAAGYAAYIVGGGVRDVLLGLHPKDFDVATDATPEQVKRLFRNSRLIGRRFKLAHVFYGRDIIEVATFRAPHHEAADKQQALVEDGRILRDNVYGTQEQDAFRRDFTINALYFDPLADRIVDYVGGMQDLKAQRLQLIGDAKARYQEDPVRMLRAVRFSSKLNFTLEGEEFKQLFAMGRLLESIAPARLFDECIKLFHGGRALDTFRLLRDVGLFAPMFPDVAQKLDNSPQDLALIELALSNTDKRLAEGKGVTPAFLFAVLLWPNTRDLAERFESEEVPYLPALQQAAAAMIGQQLQSTAIPKRFSLPMRDIWVMQYRFLQRGGRKPYRLLEHPRFRAAYDFMCLRAQVGEVDSELCEWWTHFQEADEEARSCLTKPAKKKSPRRRRNRSKARKSQAENQNPPASDNPGLSNG